MSATRRFAMPAVACLIAATAGSGRADEVKIEDIDGIRYQVTRRTIQRPVAVTEMRDQQQTVYRQQVTTDVLRHQQLYTVPVTQYQLVSRLHGRWNPFIAPYWTHEYQPVTVWQQQAATVQIPVSRVAWAPETRTVQLPTTTYRMASDEQISKVAIGPTPTVPAGSQQMMATTGATSTGPTATIAARPGATIASAPVAAPAPTYGGVAMTSDPPKQATGWQTPPDSSRYR
jgi:hypothetical protein